MNFFDTIASHFFGISSNFFHSWGNSENREVAKIQTIFVLTLFQSINLFFVVVNPILAIFFCITTPKTIVLFVGSIFLIFNYYYYVIKGRLEVLSVNNPLFFRSKVATYSIMVFYFVLSAILMWLMGNFVRNQILNHCQI